MSSLSTQPSLHPAHPSSPSPALLAADLFRSCASGNCERSWREFVARFHPRLVKAVRRTLLRLGDPGPAGAQAERVEDLVQEIYCRLLRDSRRGRRFRGDSEGQLMAYLQRVALSVVVDARRESRSAKRWGGEPVPWADWRYAPPTGTADDPGPEGRLLAAERRRIFLTLCRQALGRRADATTVRIARLALLEGWTSREIAAGLDGAMSIAGIDSLIYRLRRSLASRGVFLPRRDRLTDD